MGLHVSMCHENPYNAEQGSQTHTLARAKEAGWVGERVFPLKAVADDCQAGTGAQHGQISPSFKGS